MMRERDLGVRHQASQFMYQTRECTDDLVHFRRSRPSLLPSILSRVAVEDGIFQDLFFLTQLCPGTTENLGTYRLSG